MANNKLQIKRTTVSGRTPNTTNSGNSQYISTGELALNLADGKLFTSDGTNLINLTSSGTSLTVRSTNGNGGAVNTSVTGVTAINFDDSTGLHVTNQGSGNVFVSLGSGYKYITVSGQTTITAVGEDTINVANGQGIVLTTSNTAPKTLTITSTGYINSSAQYTFSNTITVANISANGTTGSNGQVLTSNGTVVYWATPSGGSGNTTQQVTSFTTYKYTVASNSTIFTGSDDNSAVLSYTAGFELVYINGVKQVAGADFTETDGATITLASNAVVGDTVEIVSYVVPVINSSSIQYTWTNTHTFQNTITFSSIINGYNINATSYTVGSSFVANTSRVTISGIPLSANGSNGTAGYVLTSNGSTGSPYWAVSSAGVNVAAQYTWTNTQTFSNTITFSSTINGTANNALYLGGTVASGYQTTAGLSANIATLTANASGYLNGKTESNLNVNNALTANASSYLNGKTESNLNVNNSLTSNNASYLGGTAAANYVQNSGAYTISGIHTHSANIIMSNGNVIIANGSFGANGYILTSNGTSMYWGASSASVTVSDTAPSSPTNGALWYYTGTSELFVYYDDGTSSQWVTTAATYVPSAFSTLSVSGNASFSSNVTISNTRISANGSTGTAGQVLTSSGDSANVYWSTPSAGVTTGKAIAMAIVFGG